MMEIESFKNATDGTKVIYDDPYLLPFKEVIRNRYNTFQHWLKQIAESEGSLDNFTTGYKTFGFHRVEGGIRYKVWAPEAHSLSIFGEFNQWNRQANIATRNSFGVWEAFIPNRFNGEPAIPHNSKVKLSIGGPHGSVLTRLDPWAYRVTQEPNSPVFDGVYWDPTLHPYEWKHAKPPKPDRLRIYEAHVGMASQEGKIGTYKEFTQKMLPYIADMGYNCVQLMAIMEHTYYASFGYQVTNFFASSSRYGTPNELKELIDTAHALGITVLLDVIHSHASKNSEDGLNYFDGTDKGYFKGSHPIWDSRLFNYESWEVLRFLLSNLRFWIDEYHFDGFRFDGITAMLLNNRAVGDIPQDYEGYFGAAIDPDALRYLTMANFILHEFYPDIITVAEDATGFATLCRPCDEGGVGFDYRLALGMPDKWKKQMLIKDEDWDMGSITFELSNRRWKEATVSYVESHDQALVGDKTIAFWLMDKEMYTGMSVLQPMNHIVDRGIQLHKMIRLVTFGLGGEGYLTFMGNEFGHPEWIDFPREGNGWSFHYCRRQWNLKEDTLLRYHHLLNFEKEMLHLEKKWQWLRKWTYVSLAHEGDKVIVFERGELVFAFNFHPTASYTDYKIGVQRPGKYRKALESDAHRFGGHQRLDTNVDYFTQPDPFCNRENSMLVCFIKSFRHDSHCHTRCTFLPVVALFMNLYMNKHYKVFTVSKILSSPTIHLFSIQEYMTKGPPPYIFIKYFHVSRGTSTKSILAVMSQRTLPSISNSPLLSMGQLNSCISPMMNLSHCFSHPISITAT
uniref:1,4-alpha-glucan branching enzyme n=1 Tax=Arcella intermedia TaxID=1963864 RepID=A0A6B2KY18_9EUKA